jgi:flagellar basal-body rod protein FlgB
LSVQEFQAELRERIDQREQCSSGLVRFDDLQINPSNPTGNILFHDRNNRSMESLATDLSRNALMHNLAVELLRKQFQQMEMALKERVV